MKKYFCKIFLSLEEILLCGSEFIVCWCWNGGCEVRVSSAKQNICFSTLDTKFVSFDCSHIALAVN